MNSALVIADSHIFAIRQAVKDCQIDGIDCLYLRDKQYRPLHKGNTINRKIKSIINAGETNARTIFLSIRGNHHSILGLVNHPVPFDFILKDNPNLPLNDNAYIIPYVQVYEVMYNMIKDKVLFPIKLFSKIIKNDIYYLESPPPNPSDEHIKKYPEIFKDKIEKYGVSPKTLRFKLWRLHSSIIKMTCNECGIHFISVPEDSIDGEGFLKEKYWVEDPTHANAQYGKLVIDQIKSISDKLNKL